MNDNSSLVGVEVVLDVNTLQLAVARDDVLNSLPSIGRCSFQVRIATRVDFIVEISTTLNRCDVTVREASGLNDSVDFSIILGSQTWDDYRKSIPPPGRTTIQAILATVGWDILQGNRRKWAQYAAVVERVMLLWASIDGDRQISSVDQQSLEVLPHADELAITGRYCSLNVDGVRYRVYYEESGTGVPIICLHTAGSDSRQYRHILEDREIAKDFRVVAFDMPWHGRSSAPSTWREQRYALRKDWYSAVILEFMNVLGLESPVLMGCSVGGSIALYMASAFGEKFSAILALEGGVGNPRRFVDWTGHLEVNGGVFLPTWVEGLMSPNSPPAFKEEVLWQYAQSGPGVYQGDTYMGSVDLNDSFQWPSKAGCPLWVLSGEYDYSTTPAMSQRAAEQLGGTFIPMPGMGHFPMTENPIEFRKFLVPILEQISESVGRKGLKKEEGEAK